MSYFIKSIHKTSDVSEHKNYFEANLKKLSIEDNYHNLWISGRYNIKSNSQLPNYSFYVDVTTEFGQVLNIPLYYNSHLQTVAHPTEERTYYTVDEYTFSFNLNIFQSSQFNEYIKYKQIKFVFAPMFNQTVINDFKVETTTEDLQGFVADMNKSVSTYDTEYSNTYDLDVGVHRIFLNPMEEAQKTFLDVTVNGWDNEKVFNDFLVFTNLDEKLNVIEINFQLTFLNTMIEPLKLLIPPILYNSQEAFLGINQYIKFNAYTNKLESKYLDGLNGVFVEGDAAILLEAKVKFQYKKVQRTINLRNILKATSIGNEQVVKNLKIQQQSQAEFTGVYSEIESEKIF